MRIGYDSEKEQKKQALILSNGTIFQGHEELDDRLLLNLLHGISHFDLVVFLKSANYRYEVTHLQPMYYERRFRKIGK